MLALAVTDLTVMDKKIITDIFSLVFSSIAIFLSGLTAWLTLFRKGKLKMTKPTPILLCYEKGNAKISFYTMFYSTAFRGQLIESIYILFEQNKKYISFNKWGYDSEGQVFTSGLYIKPEGIAQNHQFYTSDKHFSFQPGVLKINIYANLANKKNPIKLESIPLRIPVENEADCKDKTKGFMFEWESDRNSYLLRIDVNAERFLNETFRRLKSITLIRPPAVKR